MNGSTLYRGTRLRRWALLALPSLFFIASCESSPTESPPASESPGGIMFYEAEGRSLDAPAGDPAFAGTTSTPDDDASLIVNGSFERNGGAGTSTFEGWSVHNEGDGSWFVKTGEAYDAPEPPEGSFAASTDQLGWGARFLYQDVELPPEGGVLSFRLILRTEAEIHTPESLDHLTWPNQQFRVDVIDPDGPLTTLDPLLAVFHTPEGPAGSAYWSEYETVTADLAELGGQTVRIRFAQVDNVFYFRTTVDDVRLVPHGAGEPEDETPPVITSSVEGTLGQDGWYTSDVAVGWEVSDAESAFTTEGCEPATVSDDTHGVTFVCEATSEGGTSADTVTVKRDATAPEIAFAGNAGSYSLDQTVTITCTATDAHSGIAAAECPGVDAPAYTLDPGENALVAWATDRAGNEAETSTLFTVEVTPDGLCALVEGHVGNKGVAGALCGNVKSGSLNAFRNQLKAQAGKQIPDGLAEILLGWLEHL